MVPEQDVVTGKTLVNSPYDNKSKLSGRIYWIFEIIVRVGSYIRNLEVDLCDFTRDECETLCRLIYENCPALERLKYIGPTSCTPEEFEPYCIPNLDRVWFFALNYIDLSESTIAKFMAQPNFRPTHLEFHQTDFTGNCLLNTTSVTNLLLNSVDGLQMGKTAQFLQNNNIESLSIVGNEVDLHVFEVLAVIPNCKELIINGCFTGLTPIYRLQKLKVLDLNIPFPDELNTFLGELSVLTSIEHLSIQIDCELTIAAVCGFENFTNLKSLKIVSTFPYTNEICKRLSRCPITSLDIHHDCHEDFDVAEMCEALPNVETLRLTVYKATRNLSVIHTLAQLKVLEIVHSKCNIYKPNWRNIIEVNALLISLGRKRELCRLHTLELNLNVEFQVASYALRQLCNVPTLKKFTFRGSHENLQRFHEVGWFINANQLTYIEMNEFNFAEDLIEKMRTLMPFVALNVIEGPVPFNKLEFEFVYTNDAQ